MSTEEFENSPTITVKHLLAELRKLKPNKEIYVASTPDGDLTFPLLGVIPVKRKRHSRYVLYPCGFPLEPNEFDEDPM